MTEGKQLAVTICATKSYTYAMAAQARRVAANVRAAKVDGGHVILVGDAGQSGKEASKELQAVRDVYLGVMPPETWEVHVLVNPGYRESAKDNYKSEAQLLIAAMREDAFTAARKLGVRWCWSLDSDVLPPPNALRCSLDMLRFDDGWYGVAQCPYPNSSWLGGRGSYQHPIEEDFLPHERKLPWKLERAWAASQARLEVLSKPGDRKISDRQRSERVLGLQKEQARAQRLHAKVRECPPDGTIWEVIAKHGWRQRGWLDFAYPGIGLGAVVPSDWCGFGCTLLSESALALASFEGYDGQGTEDLFVVWQRWAPAGVRICCITHCPCSHVIWERKKLKTGTATKTELSEAHSKYVLLNAYHEPTGETIGHLRYRTLPWAPER